MSGYRLREAARVLRERAEAVKLWDGGEVVSVPDAIHDVIETSASAYIATVHPEVGKALADWLDDEAKIVAQFMVNGANPAALAVVEAILGGAS